jgi:hypothetical protein
MQLGAELPLVIPATAWNELYAAIRELSLSEA